MPSKPELRDVSLSSIFIPPHRKPGKPATVKALADSILAVGLLHPIAITEGGRLIAGRNRLAAYELMDAKSIPAFVFRMDDLRVELAEIDENLQRKQLTQLEYGEELKRRKEIWEAMYPGTKHGGDRKSTKTSSGQCDHSKSFADDTSSKTGQSPRTVRRAVEVAEKLTETAAEAIRDTPVADNRSELKKLADLPEPEQVVVAEAIASGKAQSVGEALGKKRPGKKADATEIIAKTSALDASIGALIDKNGIGAVLCSLARTVNSRKASQADHDLFVSLDVAAERYLASLENEDDS